MASGIQTNIMNNLPTVGTGTLIGSITINAGTSVNLLSIPTILRSTLNSAYAALVPAEPSIPAIGGRCISLMGAVTGLTVGHKTVGASTVAGFPLPHVPTGGGAHPQPLSFPLGDFSNSIETADLMVFNPTAGNIVLHIIYWAEK